MVYAIVTCHNQLEALKACLAALLKQDFSDLRVLVVDDGSSDGTAEFLRSKVGQLDYVVGSGDLFWGGGVAYGYDHIRDRLALDDYVLLVNSDSVLAADCVSVLVGFLKSRSNRAIAHALTVDSSDRQTVIGSGSVIRSWPFFLTWHPLRGMKLEDVAEGPQKVHTVTARALLVPAVVIDRVGFIDKCAFRHYGGDSDFGVRCCHEDFQPYIVPQAHCFLDVMSTGVSSRSSDGCLGVQLKGLVSIRSANNLINRWRFGRNCPAFWRPFYFVSSVAKIFLGILVSYIGYHCRRLVQ